VALPWPENPDGNRLQLPGRFDSPAKPGAAVVSCGAILRSMGRGNADLAADPGSAGSAGMKPAFKRQAELMQP